YHRVALPVPCLSSPDPLHPFLLLLPSCPAMAPLLRLPQRAPPTCSVRLDWRLRPLQPPYRRVVRKVTQTVGLIASTQTAQASPLLPYLLNLPLSLPLLPPPPQPV